jgi:hypothetical protein
MKPVNVSTGLNRTGVGTSPIDSKEMLEGADLGPISPGGPEDAEALRRAYAEDEEPLGSVPPPTTVQGAVVTIVEAVKGHSPVIFLDKLGERLAFERTGTRLYEAARLKLEVSETWEGGPALADIQRIHDEELAHVELLQEAMRGLGADPTAVTPAADVVGVASLGLLQVISDPRTTLPQCLEALLTAELTDNDGWQMLIELGRTLGEDALVVDFERAKAAEETHLLDVRRWLSRESTLEATKALAA